MEQTLEISYNLLNPKDSGPYNGKEKVIKTKCPCCKKEIVYDPKNKYRPFCSKPCYSHDLIKWHDEDYAIKGEQASEEDLLQEYRKSKKESSEDFKVLFCFRLLVF